jgi:hypothetical protein
MGFNSAFKGLTELTLPFRTPQHQERAPVFNLHLKGTQMNIKA